MDSAPVAVSVSVCVALDIYVTSLSVLPLSIWLGGLCGDSAPFRL